ncbi:MAG: hypothetical protein R3F55_06970 [Alphaproteobacteria bacterium]
MLKSCVIALAAGIAALSILAPASQAERPRPGQDLLEWCLLSGGEADDQPAGSPIQTCCAEDGCIICDANWRDCHFEGTGGSRAGGVVLDGYQIPGQLAPGSRGDDTRIPAVLLPSQGFAN